MCVCVCVYVCVCVRARTRRSIRVHIHADAEFTRQTPEDQEMRVMGYFSTTPVEVTSGHELDLAAVPTQLSSAVENWNSRGSGFVLDRITKFVVCITKFRPMHGGSSYFEAPEYIKKKKCILNIKNYDQKCFLWSILASLYPLKQNAGEVSKYQPLERTLNVQDLKFPLQPKQAAVFEKNNPTISVNIYSLGEENGEICVEYLSREKGRKSHVNLLLLSHEVTGQRHYTCIRSMSRLVAGRTKCSNRGHVCCSCLHVFSRADLLQQHEPLCVRHPPQMVRYPNPQNEDECTVKFRARKKQHRVPFYLVCDFECFLQPAAAGDNDDDDDDDNDDTAATATNVVDRHKVCGFACYRVTEYEQHRTDPTLYSGDDVMTKFFEHVMSENREISKILGENVPMLPMSDDERALYDAAKHCHNCGEEFTRTNQQKKCRHHDHISGRFLFPACNSCNLQLKMTATSRRRQDDNDDYDEDDDDDDDDDDDYDDDANKKTGSKRKRGRRRGSQINVKDTITSMTVNLSLIVCFIT